MICEFLAKTAIQSIKKMLHSGLLCAENYLIVYVQFIQVGLNTIILFSVIYYELLQFHS